MSQLRHLVYLGSEPEWILDTVDSESTPDTVTVTVAPSADAAVAQRRQARANALVVDDTHVDDALDVLRDRPAGTTDTPLLVRQTETGRTFEEDRLVETVSAATPPDERWDRLVESHRDIRRQSDTTETMSAVTETLHWHDPDDRGDVEHLPEYLTNTPKVVEIFLNSIVDIFFVLDPQLNFRLWNDSFNEVTSYTDEEIASMTPLDVIVEDHHERAVSGIEEILETGEATAEFVMRTRHGKEIPYSFTGSLIENANGTYICGIGRDISTRKERENQLERQRDLTNRIIETSPIGILVLEADGTLLRANERATKVLGLDQSTNALGAIGEDWRLFDETGSEIDIEEHPVLRALRTGESLYGYKHRVETDEGGEVWLSTNAAPITDEDGDVSKLVVAIEDITEVKTNEQELARRTEELDEAVAELKRSNAELEQFAYVASHDLKEPLRVISNYLGLLERRYTDELDEDALDFIEYATDGAQRMRNLINGLLKYSRTQRNETPLEPTDSRAVVETVRSNLAIAIEDADATVTAGPLPTVLGNENQLVRLFQNLISNAITYSGPEPPDIHISVEQLDDRYRFTVADNGIGIAQEEKERIFDIFYSGGESDSTGIGLAVCKKIIENHGGRIWAESEPDEGTMIHFTLPTTDADHPTVARSVTTARDGGPTR